MEKRTITIPSGYRFLGNTTEGMTYAFELPDGILNKQITGCGGTTLALTDMTQNTIVACPRIQLLMNKHTQLPELTQLVYGDIKDGEIMAYLQTHEVKKLLCTFDSMSRLKRLLGGSWEGYRIVVDEFHCILTDAGFKVYTELNLLDTLSDAHYVTWMSATPCLDEILDEIPQFASKPYYQLEWEDRRKVNIHRHVCARPVDAAINVVRSYQAGHFPFIMDGDRRTESREAVMFLNSVNNICNIIRQTGLKPEDVNIIVSDMSDNHKAIAEIGEGFVNGIVPLRGEPHKMFTFCTSTAYMGVDFYSECATTFVFSDCHRSNTSVCIETELPQIAGRQRLETNPFRNEIFFIYNTWNGQRSMDELLADIEHKQQLSREEAELYNSASDGLRQKLRHSIEREKRACLDDLTYTFYNEKEQRFECNPLSVLSEKYEMMVQYSTYHDGTYVFRELSAHPDFNVSNSVTWLTLTEHVANTITKTTFEERMQQYCEYRNAMFAFMSEDLEQSHPELRTYYDTLGAERIHALGYKENRLKKELHAQTDTPKCTLRFAQIFPVGTELTATQFKQKMNEVYTHFSIDRKGKVSDLNTLYGFKVTEHNRTNSHGKRERTYEITAIPKIINN